MTSITSYIKKQSLPIYFLLTFLISWGTMSMMISPYSFPLTPEQSESVGPLLYVGMLVGPSISGLLMIGLMNGKTGYRELFSRLTKWRVGLQWYGAAILGAPILATIVLLALSMISPVFTPALLTSNDKAGLLMTGIGVGLMVALFEELGWTGFSVPQLRTRYGVNKTGLIIGLLWGAWHFPPFWSTTTFSGVVPFATLLCQLFAWLPAFRVLMVKLYDETGSLLVTILMHASLVFTTLTLPSMELSGVNLLIWLVAWGSVLWGLIAVIDRRQ
ncbi:MAG: CPBP family intramembrane metalloprotease [Candidatus Bathyarchaeota archaeon]|nr:CPBP family intramembrane metalloprotease [Candidatus Bathyarchaeota archaeon]